MSDVLRENVGHVVQNIMSDINTEKIHDRHAKCLSQFRGMSVINHVNVGQNV